MHAFATYLKNLHEKVQFHIVAVLIAAHETCYIHTFKKAKLINNLRINSHHKVNIHVKTQK